VKTSIRQDVKLATTILETCKRKKVAEKFLVLHINQINHILEGRPLDTESNDFEERVHIKKFDNYANSMLDFLIFTNFCRLNKEMVNMETRAIFEINYVKLTKFGHTFLWLPPLLQRYLFGTVIFVYFLAKNVKKHKWLATMAFSLANLIGWIKTHNISIELFAIASAFGIAATSIFSWINKILYNSESE
jgi:hypothetical protein